MAGQGGYGLQVTMNGTVLVGVEDADFTPFMKFIDEATAHDSPGGYYEAVATGKRRIEPMAMTMIWDINEATHAAFLTAFNSDDAQQFTMADPDGDETIEFNAHVERLNRVSRQEETYRAEVELHPTGTATIT